MRGESDAASIFPGGAVRRIRRCFLRRSFAPRVAQREASTTSSFNSPTFRFFLSLHVSHSPTHSPFICIALDRIFSPILATSIPTIDNALPKMMQLRADSGDALQFKYFTYDPSMAAAVIFLILFAAITSLHLFKMIKSKTWFMTPFCIGGLFEFIGYIGRAACAGQTPNWTLGPYIVQALFLLVAPALFAASIYMELGRIVLMVDGERALFIRRTWMTKIFVFGDVFSFFLQGSGGGLLSAGTLSSINTGKKIIVFGLLLQIIFFGLFVITAALFHIRIRKMPTQQCYDYPWAKHMYGLYAVSVIIFVRSCVRVLEYAQGYDGYIISHEVYIYIFDGTLMFTAMCIMAWIHPAEVSHAIRVTTARKQPGSEHGGFVELGRTQNASRMDQL
ncbi:RTA1 domain protein [Acrodontium crateriforme]|uniref:RTA1 domain protein n=1 Tax=Acrodontium crateriforme TaxID=150365 RepID=A0AAQ3R7W1_9PEZI|nr:RTA1 domain protein [Acrodontium crateriforme]